MPKPVNGRIGGFQLWVNLPRASKLMDPWYLEIKSDTVPVHSPCGGISIRVICGTVNSIHGPVWDIVVDPEYLDISLGPDMFFTLPVKPGYMALAYVIGGEATFDPEEDPGMSNQDLLLFGDGAAIRARSSGARMRFLNVSGKPLGEHVAWRNPVVMNTQEELRLAFQEYADRTFI